MRKLQELYAWGIIKYDIPKLTEIARPYLEIYKREGRHIFVRPKKEFARITITGDHEKGTGLVIFTLECFADPVSMLKRYLTFMGIPYELNTDIGSIFLRGEHLYGGMFIFNSLEELQESVREYINFKKEVLSC